MYLKRVSLLSCLTYFFELLIPMLTCCSCPCSFDYGLHSAFNRARCFNLTGNKAIHQSLDWALSRRKTMLKHSSNSGIIEEYTQPKWK